ncbi:MAG: 6-bladed beta-propeller [Balneolaceae bacterium]
MKKIVGIFFLTCMLYANTCAQEAVQLGEASLIASSDDAIGTLSASHYSNSMLFATESRAGKVHVFNDKLERINSFGQHGRGPGDLYFPSFITEIDGKIYISEVRLLRLSVFTQSGEYIESIPLPIRPRSFALFNNSLITYNRNQEPLFYIVDLDNGTVQFDFGNLYNPSNTRNRYELAARNLYHFEPVSDNSIVIINTSNGNIQFANVSDTVTLRMAQTEIVNLVFLNRKNYTENYFKNTNLENFSYPTFIKSASYCKAKNSVFISFTGQDGESIKQGMLMELRLHNGNLEELNTYDFTGRHFREFALNSQCNQVIFYDLSDGVILKYALEN